MWAKSDYSLSVLFEDILNFDPPLANYLKNYPDDALLDAVDALKNILRFEAGGNFNADEEYFVRVATQNNSNEVKLTEIRAIHIDNLIFIKGIIIRASNIKPEIIESAFECPLCGNISFIPQKGLKIQEPEECSNPNCNNKKGFTIKTDQSKFIDYQILTLQQVPEDLEAGNIPKTLITILKNDLVGSANPGQRVKIMGIFKSTPQDGRKGSVSKIFNTHLEANYIEGLKGDDDEDDITEEDIKEILSLSKEPEIQKKIARSIAPSILGRERLKMASALSLFGGNRKKKKGGSTLRGDIHVLFIGDPGTGKSIHGSEKIYIGVENRGNMQFKSQQIGPFIDDLIQANYEDIVKTNDTEVLNLENIGNYCTMSFDTDKFRTKKTRILEVSRHKTKILFKIMTQSGRSVLSTKDHSFSTILNGEIHVLTAEALNIGTYLPIARKVNFNSEDMIAKVNLAEYIKKNDLVSSLKIHKYIEMVEKNLIGKMDAAENLNISPSTFRQYSSNTEIVPCGNWVRNKYDSSWFPKKISLDKTFGRIIGFYLAEGNIESTSIRITNTDPKILKILENDIKNKFEKCGKYENSCFYSQSSVSKWFKKKFGNGAEKKTFPLELVNSPIDFRVGLLSAYFTGDGWVDENSASLMAASKSKCLLSSISDLLSTFGIFSSLHKKIIKSGEYKGNIYHTIKISGEDLLLFEKIIGLLSNKKSRLHKLSELVKKRKRYQSLDLVPNFGTLIKDILDEISFSNRRGTWERSFRAEIRGKTALQYTGRKYMQKIVGIIETYVKEKDFNYPDSLQKLKNLAFSDVYWDKIIKIEEVHKNCYVYDIGTEDGHFIICNGNLIVHNSQILQHCSQIAHRSVYTSGKGASAAGLCVSKDTKIFYNGSVQPISKIVESQISKNPIRYYNDTMAYIINENKYNSILHCNNFKIQEQSISRFWKITSPKKLCKIDCKTGKSLTLTPQTPLLTINPEDGLVWKPASKLKSGEFVAILKKLSLSNSKNIPTLYTILKSYPGNITLLKLPDIIKNLISKLNKKFGISISDIASDLGILDHKINAWQSDVSKGKIIIKHLIFLCEKANCDINNILPDFVNIETKRGQTIKIPKNVDFDWFYMLGLLIGDISIGSEFQDQCYNEGSIGFSNPDEYNLSYFSKFFSKLDLIPNITSKCDNQRREYHIHSKIIHYIFKYFGLPVISKSKKIKANWDILGYPPEYLYSFLTGLYDANGWILTKKDNFSHIVYSSFSKELSEFIQYALSTLGIISNLNIIQPKKTNKKEDSENTGRFQQYEISFSNYGDFLIFKDKIGFNHPEKNKELEKYCNKKNNFELNIDHIPYIRPTLKEIGEFYDVVNQDKVDFKRYFSSINESVSQKKLKEILNIIEPEWKNHKVQLPYELRNSFYLDLKRTYSKQEIKEKMDISESKLSDYFLRKTKDNSIPISIFTKFLDDDSVLFTSRLRILFESIISEILDKHEIFKEKNKLLDSLSKSEIYWDEISNIQFIDSKDDFVYDLTVPESHNFIANLFVTHNTAAVVKENDNVGMQLEAGALVLASGGTACTTGRSSFIQEDGTIMTFHDLFKNFKEDHVIIYPKFKILGMDEDTLKIKPFNIKHAFKQKTNKKLFRIMTQSGREIDLTEDNEMFISKNSCFQWIETKDLKIGDYIAVPKFLSLKNKDNYTENFAYIAGLIASDGHIQFSKRRGRVDFYNSNQGLLKKYKCLLNDQNYPFYEYIRKPKEEAKIKSKLNNHQITVNRKKFASDLIKFGIPAGNKSSKFSISWKIMQYSDNTILNFIGGVFDGDGSIRSSLNSIYITSGLEKNARLFQLLLLRFGILSKIYNTKNEWFNEITGRNRVKQFCELIHSHHPKKRSLMLKVKELSIKDRIDILPNHQKKFEEIKLDFKGKLGKEYYKYVWNYCKEGVSPSIFHLKQLNDYLYDEYFEKIIDSHILWDQIIDITPIEEEFVYDFKMEETNNFVSNNFIQHNCIDEFDKMRVQDRSAIHEAMEQQSYHPKFELTFANKLTVEIGTFVDELFSKYPNRQIEGKDCEILSMEGLNYKVISTDFKDIKNIPVNRVSRHKAPDHLFNITYSNGRSILVTPEHPIFTIGQDCEIITKDASEIEINSFIPAAKDLHYNCNLELDCDVYEGTKEVRLPSYLNLDLAKFLGYFVTEGYSYSGSSAEIGLSNTDPRIINEMIENIQNTFGVDPIDNTEKNRTIRIISLNIYNYLEKNFPEIMNKSYEKRIPYQVFGLDEGARIAFLRAAFDGDGGVESTSIAYYTSSERLAYDYQDLLLTLGFHSRILSELYTFGENYQQSRLRYKIYIRGDSIKDFCEKVIPHVLENLNLQEILQKNQNSNRKHDVLPAFTANIIIKCLKLLGLSDDGYFDTHLKKNHGINREIIDSRIDLLTYQLEKISSPTDQINTVKEIREFLGYSQQKIADLIGITRENIDYCENGGYTPEKRAEIVRNIKGKIPEIISQAQSLIEKLENLKKFRWLRIKDINMLENKGDIKTEWVYDVTIEPTECFISHGVVLHNTVSIAKAGIVATLQSRTSIIAAANPKDGRWDDFVPALENVNLSPPIRSRFDLILKVRDIPNQNEDDRVAEHILRNHMEGLEEMLIEEDSELEDGEQKNSQDIITMDLLQKYIRYARGNFHPRLTKSAAKKIQEFYVEMRNSNNDSSAVAIVARNLESLVRMCEAYAKMALQEYVRDKDVDAVLEIEMQHLKDIGFDEETGSYDVDILQTGKSANARKKAKIINRILDFIKELQKNNPDPFEFDDIAEPLILEGIEEEIIKEALDQWTASGTLYQPTNHTYSLVTPRKKKNKH